ncbi:hypothetical protein GCM10022378_11540 [Salinicoccus jeotgali]|uniref:Phage protein n=1 Tax=Salinicoccus jeotgali TaxID=381634 RepID=A0ABP7ERS6_9STAP
MAKYRKKPVEVEAMKFTDKDKDRVFMWMYYDPYISLNATYEDGKPVLKIRTREGIMTACEGDYIIKEPSPTENRRFYPCKPDIFHATYELVE